MVKTFIIISLASIYATRADQLNTEHLIFHENFDHLNFTRWSHEVSMSVGGNWEFQLYDNDREVTYIRNNTLYITPKLTEEKYGQKMVLGQYSDWRLNRLAIPSTRCTDNRDWGCERIANFREKKILPPVISGKLSTKESFWFKYGRVEFTARMPVGDWLWPALWLLPKYDTYGEWPRSGEIDVVEARGNNPGEVSSALHWGEDWTTDAYKLAHKYIKQDPSEFHTYGLYWDKERLYTYLDDPNNIIMDFSCKVSPITQAGLDHNKWNNLQDTCVPFNHEMYLIINLAVGGTTGYFKDTVGKPWKDTEGASYQFYQSINKWHPTWKRGLEVRDIKVWQNKSCDN